MNSRFLGCPHVSEELQFLMFLSKVDVYKTVLAAEVDVLSSKCLVDEHAQFTTAAAVATYKTSIVYNKINQQSLSKQMRLILYFSFFQKIK